MKKNVTKEEYLDGLLNEIERNKKKGKRFVHRINVEIDHNTARYVKDYFKDDPCYTVDVDDGCTGCKNKWDITVLFRKC